MAPYSMTSEKAKTMETVKRSVISKSWGQGEDEIDELV